MNAPLPRLNSPTFYNDLLTLRTQQTLQFIDLTTWVTERVRRSRVRHGCARVQVLHTTAAIVVNECEPLLFEDFGKLLERIAPLDGVYAHDDMNRRTVNLVPGERANGHAHAQALLLGGSKTLSVIDGRVELGRWQSVLLVELDGPRKRSISINVTGHPQVGS